MTYWSRETSTITLGGWVSAYRLDENHQNGLVMNQWNALPSLSIRSRIFLSNSAQ